MTGQERRQQLLDIGRRLFAERGFDGTSIEEIAAQAGVSKPVVYEHFGGKEGLYAVVVDREVERLTTVTMLLFQGPHSRPKFEASAVSLLRYIEENADGFRVSRFYCVDEAGVSFGAVQGEREEDQNRR